MLPSRLKRKLAVKKGQEAAVENKEKESDYESDEVKNYYFENVIAFNMIFLNCRRISCQR